MTTSRETFARWFCLVWSVGTSCVVAIAVQAVSALWIPVVASVLLIVPVRGQLRQDLSVIGFVTLLLFMVVAMLSVGVYYLPSVFAALIAASPSVARSTNDWFGRDQ